MNSPSLTRVLVESVPELMPDAPDVGWVERNAPRVARHVGAAEAAILRTRGPETAPVGPVPGAVAALAGWVDPGPASDWIAAEQVLADTKARGGSREEVRAAWEAAQAARDAVVAEWTPDVVEAVNAYSQGFTVNETTQPTKPDAPAKLGRW